jgi:hypothetical protein
MELEHWFYHDESDSYAIMYMSDAEASLEDLLYICPVGSGYEVEAKVAHAFIRNGQTPPDMRSTGGRKIEIKKAVDKDSQPSAADLVREQHKNPLWLTKEQQDRIAEQHEDFVKTAGRHILIHKGNVDNTEVRVSEDGTRAVILYPIPVTPGEPLLVEAEGFSRTCPLRFMSWTSFWQYITDIRPDAAMTQTVTYQGQTYETQDIMSSALEEIQSSLLTVEDYYKIRRAIMGPVNTWTEDKERLANCLFLFTKREGVPQR